MHPGSIKRLCMREREKEREDKRAVEGGLGGGQFQGDQATGTEVKESRSQGVQNDRRPGSVLEGGAPLSSAQLLEEPENVPKRRRTAEEGCGHPGEPRGPQYGHSESRTRATAEAGSEVDGPELEHRPARAWGRGDPTGRRRASRRRAAEVQLMVTGRSVLTGVLPSCCAGFIRSLQTTVSHRLLHQVLDYLSPA